MIRLLIVAFLFLSGCATAYMRDRECFDRPVDPISLSKEGLLINGQTNYDQSSFSLDFKNNTKSDIKIIWSESYFLDNDGVSKKLFADGKIADKSKPTPDTLVPAGSLIKSSAAVSENISWESGWKYAPLCGHSASPLGKLNTEGCDNLKLFLTYHDSKKKNKAEFTIKMNKKIKTQCEGYNLDTGEKIK